MTLNKVWENYFQKSRIFLYPILGIKKNSTVKPVNTYITWKGFYSIGEPVLICKYEISTDEKQQYFEKQQLRSHPLFKDFFSVENASGKKSSIFVFDMSQYSKDFDNFVKGKYSLLTKNFKTKLRVHYGKSSGDYKYIQSYLYPQQHVNNYAELLWSEEEFEKGVDLLIEVGELCSPPDIKKETLKAHIYEKTTEKNE